jgi:uncharacterized protein YjbI with pentapeptide repeats
MNANHRDILDRGLAAWNEWRQSNPGIKPVLAGLDLSDRDLSGVNFSETDLSETDLCQSDLSNANLKLADFRGADLSGSNLTNSDLYKCDFRGAFLTESNFLGAYAGAVDFRGADLRGVNFEGANLTEANLAEANLMGARLIHADLARCCLVCADLRHAEFAGANLVETQYGNSKTMRGKYFGISGLESASGNALFVRNARDQDYLDTMEQAIAKMPPGLGKFLKSQFFRAWGLIDYGRSLITPLVYASAFVVLFGIIYGLDMVLSWGLVDFAGTSRSLITPFYFSVVTYTTLGFGDVTPIHWIGELLVIVEVILGYTTLGLILSILANKVARRS